MAVDTRSVFRKVVTNQPINGFDYINTEFAFKTLYKISKYTYRCCPCAFEHEYLDYIGHDGEINEEMYERIVNSIIAGQCPHVNEGNTIDDTAETGVYAVAIALALGTETLSDKTVVTKDKCRSTLFEVDPFMLAIKINFASLPLSITEYCQTSKMRAMVAQRMPKNTNKIVLEKRDALELCILNKNEKLIEEMPIYGTVAETSLRAAFRSRNERVVDAVMQKIDLTNHRTEWNSHECCRLSIIYDRPDILQMHLDRFSSTFHVVRKNLEHMLTTYCKMLERPRCKDAISKFNKYGEKQTTLSELVVSKLSLFREFNDDKNIRDEILLSLESIKLDNPTEFKIEDFLQFYSKRIDYDIQINAEAFKEILDAAAGLFDLPQNDISHLNALLGKRFAMGPGYRQVMEILLFENPDFDGNTTLFKKCLEVDNSLENTRFGNDYGLHTSLIMDCRQHAMFNHDDAQDFALNFTAPLLIECGCPLSMEDYTAIMKRYGDSALQEAEKEYICHNKSTHKSLAGVCRDVLRRHFKGPRIHRFVKQSKIPSKIKYFILLKDILKYIPDDMFC